MADTKEKDPTAQATVEVPSENGTPKAKGKPGRKPRKNLRDMSLEELLAAATAVDLSQYEEFPRIRDKADLVDVDFVVTDWKWRTSPDKTWIDAETGEVNASSYVRVYCVRSSDGTKFSFADGGAGIPSALDNLLDKTKKTGPFRFPKGLTPSTYDVETPDGTKQVTTWYFSQE